MMRSSQACKIEIHAWADFRAEKSFPFWGPDIVELISGPFKREQAKVIRIDKTKEEVVVELLEAAVPIPITVKLDAVKVIRRESDEGEE